MSVTINGLWKKFVVNHCRNFIRRLNEKKSYRKRIRFYSVIIQEGDLCFDIGAHHGNRTEVFLKLGAKVVAVEPQESCVDYLKKKFKNESRLTIENKGVAEKEGKLEFYICDEATTISTFSDKWTTVMKDSGRFSESEWNKTELVPVTTLDNLIKKYGVPTFCKIDVEGFELQVIKGLSQPIPYISFEFTREFFSDAKSCINHLQSIDDIKLNCSLWEEMQLLFNDWVTPKELYQRLNSIDDDFLSGDIYVKFKQ